MLHSRAATEEGRPEAGKYRLGQLGNRDTTWFRGTWGLHVAARMIWRWDFNSNEVGSNDMGVCSFGTPIDFVVPTQAWQLNVVAVVMQAQKE